MSDHTLSNLSRLHTFEEIWFEIDIENVPAKTLNRIIEWKDVDPLAIFDVETLMYVNYVPKLDA